MAQSNCVSSAAVVSASKDRVKARAERVFAEVQKFDPEKGFGFIVPVDASGKEDRERRVFVHRKSAW